MIRIENVEIYGWEAAIRGMRNPLNSWDKSDSGYETHYNSAEADEIWETVFNVGNNDLELMQKLVKAGTDHRKFMRMITVYVDVTSHHGWWAEADTYKVGTVRNSCSKMHTIHVKGFCKDDFSHEGIDEVGDIATETFEQTIKTLEQLRVAFNETGEKKYWRAIIELLPLGYNIRATLMLNYEVLANIYHSRKNHKLDEWRDFCTWIETLPYSELITGGNDEQKNDA